MAVVAIIPARYGSSRLPGKPLATIGGKPMIQHVYESTARAKGLDRVLVATDDERIQAAVQSFGGEVMMTSARHASGTDRLAEVARKIKAEWVVNVQGDLPFIQAHTITRAIRPLQRTRSICMGTVSTPIYDEQEWRDPNVVKVVVNLADRALYFSRRTIPYLREAASRPASEQVAAFAFLKHIGIYGYRKETLVQLVATPVSPLERAEQLEQLRALETITQAMGGVSIEVGKWVSEKRSATPQQRPSPPHPLTPHGKSHE